MSLLLEARKKSRQAQSAQRGDPVARVSEHAETGGRARNAGHNLFAVTSSPQIVGHTPHRRDLLYALGGTVLLFAAGAVHFRYSDSAGNTAPLHPAAPAPQNARVSGIAGAGGAGATRESGPITPVAAASAPIETPQPYNRAPASSDNGATRQNHNPAHTINPILPSRSIRIEQQKTEPVDPLLMDAYLAYRSGKLGEARKLYLAIFAKDARNPDVLLGLAAIAQQQGEDRAAVQYLGRVLALDPRNAAANAGMAALSKNDDYSERRLKTLLREQDNSAALHFALGNLYAGQSRWSEAQQSYFNAFLLESGNAGFAFNLAVSLDHLAQKALAAQHYRRAMQLDPSRGAGFDHAQVLQRALELEH